MESLKASQLRLSARASARTTASGRHGTTSTVHRKEGEVGAAVPCGRDVRSNSSRADWKSSRPAFADGDHLGVARCGDEGRPQLHHGGALFHQIATAVGGFSLI